MAAQHDACFGSGGSPPSAVDHLDARLAKLSRADAALCLRLGQVLEVLHRRAQHFALGFSSSSAYALERCGRSVRSVEGARCLARRLEALPALRVALARRELSWSVAELSLASHDQEMNRSGWPLRSVARCES